MYYFLDAFGRKMSYWESYSNKLNVKILSNRNILKVGF